MILFELLDLIARDGGLALRDFDGAHVLGALVELRLEAAGLRTSGKVALLTRDADHVLKSAGSLAGRRLLGVRGRAHAWRWNISLSMSMPATHSERTGSPRGERMAAKTREMRPVNIIQRLERPNESGPWRGSARPEAEKSARDRHRGVHRASEAARPARCGRLGAHLAESRGCPPESA